MARKCGRIRQLAPGCEARRREVPRAVWWIKCLRIEHTKGGGDRGGGLVVRKQGLHDGPALGHDPRRVQYDLYVHRGRQLAGDPTQDLEHLRGGQDRLGPVADAGAVLRRFQESFRLPQEVLRLFAHRADHLDAELLTTISEQLADAAPGVVFDGVVARAAGGEPRRPGLAPLESAPGRA